MKDNATVDLRLGTNVVEMLLRQRRPFLMVDHIRSFEPGAVPALHASRHISANEPVFAGHFDDIHIWPGTMTIEGMGQTSALLAAIMGMLQLGAERDEADADVLESLRNLDRGFRLHPGHDPEGASAFIARMKSRQVPLMVGASVNVQFLRPVFAGQRLDFRSAMTLGYGDVRRFECEASVDGAVVATGTLTGAQLSAVRLPGSAE